MVEVCPGFQNSCNQLGVSTSDCCVYSNLDLFRYGTTLIVIAVLSGAGRGCHQF